MLTAVRRATTIVLLCVLGGCSSPRFSPRARAATPRTTTAEQRDYWRILDESASGYTVEWALATLRDDHARGEEWAIAAHVLGRDQMLASRGDSLGAAGYARRSREAVPYAPRPWNDAALHLLAARRITTLLALPGALRAEMSRLRAAIITLALAELGPSITVLRETSRQWRAHSTEDHLVARAAAALYELRDISGDTTALGEYLEWLPTLSQRAASESGEIVLQLAVDHRDDPAVVRVFERVLRGGFWGVPREFFTERVYQSRLMGFEALRRMFIERLRDRSLVGELVIDGRTAHVMIDELRLLSSDLQPPQRPSRSPWRACDDVLARLVSQRRSQLALATIAQRDAIIDAEIARLLAPDRGQWEPAPRLVFERRANTP